MKNILILLAESILLPLELTAAAATTGVYKKVLGLRATFII